MEEYFNAILVSVVFFMVLDFTCYGIRKTILFFKEISK
jgi:hypothetical protein